ncbi:hypothetical protein CSCA_1917 [Clostridium scatologenes]|uniref:Uncharacterized protein n=1 Tax=Clostridium scatologenes TaxID=1548 RepID=A0A0E3JNB9_CLOSL|nr:hypothetical protein CSCA_1917 [Clostridium scatologenes]
MQVVPLNQHLYQLIAHDKGKHQSGNRQDNRFGKLPYEGEHAGVPVPRRSSHLCCNLSDLVVHILKKTA